MWQLLGFLIGMGITFFIILPILKFIFRDPKYIRDLREYAEWKKCPEGYADCTGFQDRGIPHYTNLSEEEKVRYIWGPDGKLLRAKNKFVN